MATTSGTLSAAQIAGYAKAAGFAGGDIVIATAVAMSESGGNPNAHNLNVATGDDSYGLWQVNMLGNLAAPRRAVFGIAANEELFDPLINAKAARHIRSTQGWGAWSDYKNGKYKTHLAAATAGANNPATPDSAQNIGNPLDQLNPAKQLQAILDKMAKWLQDQSLRVAMFIGGGFLLWLGVQIFVASSVLPKGREVVTAVKGATTKAARLGK